MKKVLLYLTILVFAIVGIYLTFIDGNVNKYDSKTKEVDKETAKKFGEENDMKYLEVSAKDGINIESMFEMMGTACAKILEKENKGEADKSESRFKKKKEKEEAFKTNSILSAKEFNKDIKQIKEHSCC